MPGAMEVIEVKYDTNRVGPIRKTISVSSNASDSCGRVANQRFGRRT
ncbi:MAG: hypothetical protein CM15mP83_6090 [Flavobacteriaceae bacterium]|nr:MAG: hypothetical protein CM15mP83_6090 [Flavobacteriaceae bacterium]